MIGATGFLMAGHEIDLVQCARRRGFLRGAEAEELLGGGRSGVEVAARCDGDAAQARGGRRDGRSVAEISDQDQPLGKQMGPVHLWRYVMK